MGRCRGVSQNAGSRWARSADCRKDPDPDAAAALEVSETAFFVRKLDGLRLRSPNDQHRLETSMKLLNNLGTLMKMIAAFGLVIAISIVVNIISWSSLTYQQTANGWTVHTYEVLDRVDAIVSAMVDRETGVRGYLLSGDEKFLEPYEAGSKNYKEAFDKAVQLTSDNATQQKRFAELDVLVKGWVTEIAEKEI
eukprot:gene34806-39351_t